MSLAANFLSEVQFQCPVCLDIFTDPVSTPCGHTFCMACIGGYWDSNDLCQCPLCKETFESRPKLCINRSFSEITELFKKMRDSGSEQRSAGPGEVPCDICTGMKLRAVKSCLLCLASYCDEHITSHSARFTKHKLVDPVKNLEDRMCKKHERLLELFCKSEQTCVCVLCTKKNHSAHSVVSLKDAVQELKTQLQRTQEEIQSMIQDKVKKVEIIRQFLELSKSSAEREIADSVQVFSDLVSLINKSQAELIEVIEEKQKAAETLAERLIATLDEEISELKRRNSELEQLSHTKDCFYFLQTFPSLCTPPHTKDWSDVTLHTELCVGTTRAAVSQLEEPIEKLKRKLSDIELKKIQQHAVDVTLDPSTANRWLVLSEDQKQVRDGDTEHDLPDGPERFDNCVCILGKEGFSSGRHYWEVQVGKKTEWDLGVARESVNRKGKITVSPAEGYWTMCLRNGNEYKCCADHSFALPISAKPQKVGVYVDYEGGQISFYNVEARSHIYTFNDTFTERLYPFFSPYLSDGASNIAPLIISPIGITHS